MKTQTLAYLLERIDQLDHATLVSLVRKFYKQKEVFEKVINIIKDGIVMIGYDGYVLLINDSAEKMLNMGNLRNMIFWKCVPELVRQINVGQMKKKATTAELHLTYPTEKFLKFYSVPFIGDEEVQIICVFSDVTQALEQKKTEIEDERTNSILLLSAGVAHEIGNPLNSINLQLEILHSFIEERNFSGTAEALTVCKQEVARLHGIIKNFLQAVRPVVPNFTNANLLELLNFTIKFLTPELNNAAIKVKMAIKGEIPTVWADIDQIKQVFFNIIKNAMEAMSAKKQLLIVASTDDDHVILKFIDSGKGIPAEYVGKIFEPFCTSKENGTGLGMFIVQRILRDHGATIAIASQENSGTTITLKFPKKIRVPKMLKMGEKYMHQLLG
ncbi:MAG: PAS domain-containing sensor histidine kinase [Puniceicoccales bacterium]|nr:PAS domain-containing sensor histidine kinase [Puniceicoccales bacterium]